MTVIIEPLPPKNLALADLKPRDKPHRSPNTWRDQIVYFLLPDRFSDGQEEQENRPLFDRNKPKKYAAKDKKAWMDAGKAFQRLGEGLKIMGIKSKLDYLQGLGVTTLWIAPIFKQIGPLLNPGLDPQTYHGYGIQNFLDVDPRFGTRQDLRDLIDEAHDRKMYVLLDIIYNHTGNNWFYNDYTTGEPRDTLSYRFSPPYDLHGWRSKDGKSIPNRETLTLEEGVWPRRIPASRVVHTSRRDQEMGSGILGESHASR